MKMKYQKLIRQCPALLSASLVILMASCKKDTGPTITNESVPTYSISNVIKNDRGLQNSVVALYTFNGNTLDSSGNSNNVIFNNATPVADRFGNPNGAYSFNGIDNYMRVANSSSLNPGRGITLYAVVRVNGFYSGECHGNRIINKNFYDSDQGSYLLNFDDGLYYNYNHCFRNVKANRENFSGGYGNGQLASIGGIDSTQYIKPGKWYYIAFTYDGSVAKFYVNGELKTTNTGSYTFTPNNSDLFFGMSNIDNTKFPYWFNGVIDDIAIFKAALAEDQLRKLSHGF